MKGKFVTFEGGEGVGKTTQLAMIKKYLSEEGKDAVFLREPGGNAVSERIRAVILDRQNADMTGMCEALLYSASRAQLVESVIRPALEEGKIVVCDRFTDSTFAYQGVARGLGADKIDMLNSLACGDIVPDLTVFLDLSPQQAFERKGGADKDDRQSTWIAVRTRTAYTDKSSGFLKREESWNDKVPFSSRNYQAVQSGRIGRRRRQNKPLLYAHGRR